MFMDDVPSFFNFWSSILIFLFLFHKLFITLFISILVAKESIRLLVSFLPLSYKNLSYPHGFPADTIIESLQGTSGFLRFSKVPDAPLFTRFRLGFSDHIELMFQQMVDYTEPICQQIDSSLAQILTFDTSGIELYVTENNPKTLNALIRKLKVYYKDIPDVDPYKMAYGLMPSQAASCPDAKQQYINGHFCYADKFAILTNGLGIIRHISFLDDDFKTAHPEMTIEKKSDSPDEDKSIGDATSLKPVLSDFFFLHPDFHPDTFLGDSSFDTIKTYGMLLNDFHFPRL